MEKGAAARFCISIPLFAGKRKMETGAKRQFDKFPQHTASAAFSAHKYFSQNGDSRG